MHLPRTAPVNAEDRKVGPIPLPWFIPMCIFTPFFISFIFWSLYQPTVVQYRNKKAALGQEGEKARSEQGSENAGAAFLEADGGDMGWNSNSRGCLSGRWVEDQQEK
jgi:hypothetical protein